MSSCVIQGNQAPVIHNWGGHHASIKLKKQHKRGNERKKQNKKMQVISLINFGMINLGVIHSKVRRDFSVFKVQTLYFLDDY